MEENQTETQETQVQEPSPVKDPVGRGVSFPTVGQPKKAGGAKTLLVLGALVLLAILGYIIFKNASGKKAEPTPTPVETLAPVITASPTATPKPADKSKVKIEVQNGTGITGEAAFLQTELKKLGYTNISVGNASSQNATITSVTFSKSLDQAVASEITGRLKEIYKEVETKTSTTATIDAVVVTGLKKGATAKPSATATPKVSPSPTSTSASTASPTATSTATPTANP